MAENYQQAAKDIIQLIGMDNIISVTHCQTRLRFILKDHEQVDGKKLEKIDLVKGVFYKVLFLTILFYNYSEQV